MNIIKAISVFSIPYIQWMLEIAYAGFTVTLIAVEYP